jgi:uncharacterized membrane protein
MNDLIVVAFDRLEDARSAMRSLRELERAGKVEFEDTAIVERMPDGKTHVRDEVSGATETGAAVGALLGTVVLFLFPVVGLVVGAAAGAAVGAAMKSGVEPSFVEQVKQQLGPGRSALFLVVRKGDADGIAAALRPFKGDVIQTTLAPEIEQEIREGLSV